jgi:hypothetical protein
MTPTDDDGLVIDGSARFDPSITPRATVFNGNDAVTGQVPDSEAAAMSLTAWLYQIAIFFSNSLLDEPALLALIFT